MTKAKRPRKRTEKRSTFRAPEQWLADALGAGKDTSGESVSETSALGLSVYFNCIRVIAEDVAKLPLIVYRRLDRGKERSPGHPLYRLLHDEPCPESTAFSFRETLTAHALGWGNGYAEIQRDGSGRPVALWPIDPSSVEVKRNDAEQIVYEVRDQYGQTTVLSPSSVLHVHGLGYSGLMGYSVARIGRTSLGSALAAQKHTAAFFGNGASPGGVLEHPGALSDKAMKHLRESWTARHGGADNAHKPAILEEGMKWHTVGIPPEDAQLLETRQWQVEDVCRWFRVPPHKIGHLLRAQGWSTLEQTNLDYLTDTLMPWLVRWEQEIQRKLIGITDSGLFAEHLVDAILRADTQTRFAAYAVGVTNGWLSRNEVRAIENLNPVDGLDEYFQPTTVQTLEQADKAAEAAARPPEPPPQQGDADEESDEAERFVDCLASAHSALLVDAYSRLRAIENDKIDRAAKRGESGGWVEALYAKHADHVAKALTPVVTAFCVAAAKLTYKDDDAIYNDIAAYVSGMAARWTQARLLQMTQNGKEPDVDGEIEQLKAFVLRRVRHGN
jgi:HK97 family phage portal protein